MVPRAKKARTIPGPSKPAIEKWLQGAGVWYDHKSIEIEEQSSCSGNYVSIVARKDLKPGDHLCTIPKDACLSVRNATCSAMLEGERLLSGLGLVVAVMHERLLGVESRW